MANNWYDQEIPYLSASGKLYLLTLIAKGIDRDLAMEVLHLLVPNEELYELGYEKE